MFLCSFRGPVLALALLNGGGGGRTHARAEQAITECRVEQQRSGLVWARILRLYRSASLPAKKLWGLDASTGDFSKCFLSMLRVLSIPLCFPAKLAGRILLHFSPLFHYLTPHSENLWGTAAISGILSCQRSEKIRPEGNHVNAAPPMPLSNSLAFPLS